MGMDKPSFSQEHKTALDALLLALPGVAAGKMFGYPAYYVGKRLFACVYGAGVGVKLPEAIANQMLSQARAVPFRPYGKPKMKEWIQINRTRSADYEQDADLFRDSIKFVSQPPNAKGKKK